MEKPQNNIEKAPVSFLEEPDIKELIRFREIKEEDWPKLEELASMPKDLLIANFHNFFNDTKEGSAKELESQLTRIDDPAKKKYWELWLHFAKDYHWMSCYGMERVLERR